MDEAPRGRGGGAREPGDHRRNTARGRHARPPGRATLLAPPPPTKATGTRVGPRVTVEEGPPRTTARQRVSHQSHGTICRLQAEGRRVTEAGGHPQIEGGSRKGGAATRHPEGPHHPGRTGGGAPNAPRAIWSTPRPPTSNKPRPSGPARTRTDGRPERASARGQTGKEPREGAHGKTSSSRRGNAPEAQRRPPTPAGDSGEENGGEQSRTTPGNHLGPPASSPRPPRASTGLHGPPRAARASPRPPAPPRDRETWDGDTAARRQRDPGGQAPGGGKTPGGAPVPSRPPACGL